MKKLLPCLVVVTTIALTLKIVGAVLLGLEASPGSRFDTDPLAVTFMDVGLIGAVLGGIALMVVVIINAVREEKK